MPAAEYNFIIEQGSTFTKTFTLTDSLAAPIDLTGQTFRGQIRELTSSPTATVAFTFVLATQSGPTLGKFTMSLTAAQTAALPSETQTSTTRKDKKFVYDVERVLSDGITVERMFQGIVTVNPEATR